MSYPSRIVCLTEETTETLYLLGEGDRVVGISGYTVRPPEARQKPKVSSFLHARYEKIEALKPDLILAFSDLQADITNDLVKRGYPVFTFNQRSVAEILQMIRVLAGIVGVPEKGEALAARFERDLDAIREQRRGAAPPSEGLLRGVVRPADQRHSLDRGAGRDRRRRSDLSRARRRRSRQGSDRHERSGDRAGARRHHRIVVRKAGAQGTDRRQAGMAGRAGRQERPDLRSEVDLHPAARTGGADRGRDAVARHHPARPVTMER